MPGKSAKQALPAWQWGVAYSGDLPSLDALVHGGGAMCCSAPPPPPLQFVHASAHPRVGSHSFGPGAAAHWDVVKGNTQRWHACA